MTHKKEQDKTCLPKHSAYITDDLKLTHVGTYSSVPYAEYDTLTLTYEGGATRCCQNRSQNLTRLWPYVLTMRMQGFFL